MVDHFDALQALSKFPWRLCFWKRTKDVVHIDDVAAGTTLISVTDGGTTYSVAVWRLLVERCCGVSASRFRHKVQCIGRPEAFPQDH